MQRKARLKTIATFLFGVALISLGLLFFIAPERAYLMQALILYWPLFLILAGLVRLGGYLLDREPPSPMGGILLSTLGGILLSANLRGESNLLGIFGRYWFFLLLALVIGRVLRQYTHQSSGSTVSGKPTRAFGPGTIFLMLLITGGGLLAHRLSNDPQQMARLRLPVSLSSVRDMFGARVKSEQRVSQSFAVAAGARLLFNNLQSDLEVRAGTGPEARATLVKSAYGETEDEASATLDKLRLQISQQGRDVVFQIVSDNPGIEYQAQMIVELPAGLEANVEASSVLGEVKLANLTGVHHLRDGRGVVVAGNRGGLAIENPRGRVEIAKVEGPVVLSGAREESRINGVTGEMTLDLAGGVARIERSSGAIRISARQARIELREINYAGPIGTAPGASIEMREVRDSRLTLASINGPVSIRAERTRIDASEIAGDLTISTSNEKVRAGRLKGSLRIEAENGSVEVANIEGAAQIEATREVTARHFTGPLVARTRLGAIALEFDSSPAADVEAESQHGSIRVEMPEDAEFGLDAATSFGRLRVRGFDRFGLPRRTKATSISFRPETPAPAIVLRSTNGDITIKGTGRAVASRSRSRQESGSEERP